LTCGSHDPENEKDDPSIEFKENIYMMTSKKKMMMTMII
jgi:hypothetical protein